MLSKYQGFYKNLRLITLLLVLCVMMLVPELSIAQKLTKSKKTITVPSALLQSKTSQTPPKKTSSPLFTTTMFRDSALTKQWKKVDSCIERGLPKSALEIVEKILTEAQKTKNLQHIVKALLQKSVLQAETNENGESTFVNEIASAIQGLEKNKDAETPENIVSLSLLRSALAEYYWLYHQQNRWKIQGRTALQSSAQDSSTDYRAWDTRRFMTTIRDLHFLALRNKEVLQRTPLSAVETMIVSGNNAGERLRPTLYDLLAFRALTMLNNTATSLPTPEEECEFPVEVGFATISAFTQHTFSTPDAQDWKYQAICLYQELLRFHAADSSADALLDANRFRLNFVKNYSFGENVQDAYIQALERDADVYKQSPIAAEYLAAIAEEYFAKGDYIKAREYCTKAFMYEKSSEKSFGNQQARALEQRILTKEMTVQSEKTVLPNSPFLVSVAFRNVEKIYFRLVSLPARARDDDDSREYFYDDEGMKRLLKVKPILTWSENMPVKDSSGVVDYKSHRVDVKVPVKSDSLAFGRYIVIASLNESFAPEKNAIAWSHLTATRLALVSDRNLFAVTDASTGEPLEGVTVRFWQQVYDYTRNKYREQLAHETKTDKNGFCEANFNGNQNSTFIELQRGNDLLRDGSFFNNYTNYHAPQPQEHVQLFTDRALYRPGQTVYFKGIAIQHDADKPDNTVLRGRKFNIKLIDYNGKEHSSVKLTTNEYGSFQGTFSLPSGGVLNGQWTLIVENGERNNGERTNNLSIRVEEYKRPKFEAQLTKPKELLRVGDIVKVHGNARNYAGSVVDGAMVQYRVVRNARFPYWRGWWWMPEPSSPEKEIARGRVKSDAKGEFEIQFPALPDKSLSPKSLPVFTYTVYADVTDISGETHSAETSVSAGYVALLLTADIPDVVEKSEIRNEKSTIKTSLQTTNLNGEPAATQGTISIARLVPPKRLLRQRLLQRADRYVMSEEVFASAFPFDSYKNEDDIAAWQEDKPAFTSTFKTNSDGTFTIPREALKNLASGIYRLRADVTDISGQKVEKVITFTITDSTATIPEQPTYLKVQSPKSIFQPGETASVLVSTSLAGAKILYRIEFTKSLAGGVQQTSVKASNYGAWQMLSHEQKRISVSIPSDFRGTISLQFCLVKNHRFVQKSVLWSVPYTNKQLRIEKSTFRDKTRPGSEEEWTLTVRGEKADAVAAELVATLYDASLDAILHNDYTFGTWKSEWSKNYWQLQYSSYLQRCMTFGVSTEDRREFSLNEQVVYSSGRSYADFDFSSLQQVLYGFGVRGGLTRSPGNLLRKKSKQASFDEAADGEMYSRTEALSASAAEPPPPPAPMMAKAPVPEFEDGANSLQAAVPQQADKNSRTQVSGVKGKLTDLGTVKARTNLSETAFFMPQIRTNEKGEIVLKFTMPEALTRWRMLAFAHTPDMKTGALEAETITQKELMLLPNMPRFLREGDEITLPVKIANLSNKQIRGVAELKLFDAITMQELPISLGFTQQAFTADAAQSSVVVWSLTVPDGLQAVVYRVVAKASSGAGSEEFSDGEEAALPVLANRMLVTETLPLNIRGNSSKTFEFKKLAEAGKSSTLRHQRLTLEMTSNPAWYAIQALPMLMEYPYDCTEQLWNRLYANSISTHLANSKPRIKAVFESWKGSKESLLSNLEKNQELKTVLLEETPWVVQATDETERKKRVGLLFDLNRMSNEATSVIQKLQERQTPNGGFTWFPGMLPNRFITQYLLSGIGHLAKLGVTQSKTLPNQVASGLQSMTERALPFLDQEIAEEYRRLKQMRGFKESNEYLSYDAIQYLYARSFFTEKPIPSGTREAFDFWAVQAVKYWMNQGLMGQSMIALALKRFAAADRIAANISKQAVPEQILKSLRERALKSDEMGMYWKQDFGASGWWWYQAPVETQALAIEAFIEVAGNEAALKEVEEMKIWLLKQKQTQDWKTTKATAEACYALLLRGADWLESSKITEVSLGKMVIDQKAIAAQGASIEAGTGYYKVSFGKGEITPDMGSVSVKKSDAGIAWGGVYWQYFERLDKITPAKTPLQLDKKLYRQNTTAKGLELEPITDKTLLRVGDLVKVRVELRSDREMEYVHLKDMRGAGLEPLATVSGYRWQNGLGYYETMRDASANFFIGWLPRGVWVFEYALRVTHEGTFQNGITTIQSMYAPEFSSHSEGVKVRVGK